ncbi:hypothetical protein AWV80_36900 [Cupriavidus sp. UYMU48A]|nr:hypothetical protein AWV80_36900 [Cupriavidus sp. UYMU48A]
MLRALEISPARFSISLLQTSDKEVHMGEFEDTRRQAIVEDPPSVQALASAVSWGAILAGGVAAAAFLLSS